LGEARKIGEPINDFHKNIAASTQKTLEDCAVSLVNYLYKLTNKRKLCISGGVGLNCSMNKVLSNLDYIEDLFVQPASSDRGLSLGCAFYAAHLNGEKINKINNVFFGPTYSNDSIRKQIKISNLSFTETSDPFSQAANFLSEGKIIAWYNGRSEFGPRALGNRSILANPGVINMKDQINSKIKFREEFRPFAPSVLEEKSREIFNIKSKLPYMTVACDVNKAWINKLPATTHINNTARVQTVNSEENNAYYKLIKEFEKLTGLPALLNTSFNIQGQPIVETPLEAISTFASTGIDVLFIENYFLEKKN
jgi:carbamoyltransferase